MYRIQKFKGNWYICVYSIKKCIHFKKKLKIVIYTDNNMKCKSRLTNAIKRGSQNGYHQRNFNTVFSLKCVYNFWTHFMYVSSLFFNEAIPKSIVSWVSFCVFYYFVYFHIGGGVIRKLLTMLFCFEVFS